MNILQRIILEIPDTINGSVYDFDWVFLEIPVKNCIVGMLLMYAYALHVHTLSIFSVRVSPCACEI